MTLTSEQQSAVLNGQPVSLDIAGAECVVIRKDVFLLLDAKYDAKPMTPLEMDLLADEADEIVSCGEPR